MWFLYMISDNKQVCPADTPDFEFDHRNDAVVEGLSKLTTEYDGGKPRWTGFDIQES